MSEELRGTKYRSLWELKRETEDGRFVWTDGEMLSMFDNAQEAGLFSVLFGPALRLFVIDDLRATRGNFFSGREPYGGKGKFPVATTPRGKSKRIGFSKDYWQRVRSFLTAVEAIEFEEEPKPGGRTIYSYNYQLERLEDLLLGRPFVVDDVEVGVVSDVNSPNDVNRWLVAVGLIENSDPAGVSNGGEIVGEMDETFPIRGSRQSSTEARGKPLNGLEARQNRLEAHTDTDHTRSHSISHKDRSHLAPFSEKENDANDISEDLTEIEEQEHEEQDLAF